MISRHHLGKNVVEAQYYCNKCGKQTMHRVDGGKKGPCLTCLARGDCVEKLKSKQAAIQEALF